MRAPITRPTFEDVKKAILEWGSEDSTAAYGARQYLYGWDAGREAGRAEAQRHLRLLLGIDVPDDSEAAYWSAPFPLAQEAP